MRTMTKLPSEFTLIARYMAPLARGFPGAYGLLDDVAMIAPAAGCELVVKTDAIVAEVDFFPADSADLVAQKALRINLSDLAAKGATPLAYLLDLILPDTIDEAWVAAFAAGLGRDQQEYGIHLIGGDFSSTPGPVTIAVTALGEATRDRIIRRGGAQPGDAIFVTGTIGDAAFGLGLRRGELGELGAEAAEFLVDRYRLPRPRVTVGPRLSGIATAALDVSDGLVADLRHICEVSKLHAIIEAPLVPLSVAAREAIADRRERLVTALTGGDDYEILFTAPPTAAGRIDDLAQELAVSITAIGRMVAPSGAAASPVVVLDAGRPMTFPREGWTHF